MSGQQQTDEEAVRRALTKWSADDTCCLLEAIRACTQGDVKHDVLLSKNEGCDVSRMLSPAEQTAYARYVYSSGRVRKDCADPYPFLKERAEKILRAGHPPAS